MSQDESRNMTLIAHDPLAGWGGMGEGMVIQEASGGRRILWLAHEGPPKNFTGVDVTDPAKPRVIVQTDLAHNNMRSNSLDLVGDIMAVAYQTRGPGGLMDPGFGLEPAGIELFDVSTPESPRTIGFFDCSGPHSMGVHQLWFADGKYIHFSGGAADFEPTHPADSQFYRSIDVSDPTKPVEVGRWWVPGTRVGDDAPPPKRHPQYDIGIRAHNTNVYPERPDRVYLAYIDGGIYILDIADMANPKPVGHWNPHPPQNGFSHTVLPLFDSELLIVSDECILDAGRDWPKLTWVLDGRDETNPVPISTLPLPPVEEYSQRGGRYGSHNIHENQPGSFSSDTLIFGTYFNGGIRVHDVSDPYRPEEVAYYVPATPEGSRVGAVQLNDVFVDENRLVYTVDRFTGGLYVLELDI